MSVSSLTSRQAHGLKEPPVQTTRCLLLTTDTKHHRYFANRIAQVAQTKIVLERRLSAPATFSVPFEKRQDVFEERFFTDGVASEWKGQLEQREYADANDAACLAWVKGLALDVLITFGTGRIVPDLYQCAKLSLNIHRGILPRYRGLDSELWACYFKDFSHLGTTLHRLESRLDTGAVLLQRKLEIKPEMQAHQLRYWTTRLATEMALELIKNLKQGRTVGAVPQDLSQGRYYGAISPWKRRWAVRRLDAYIRGICHE